MKKCLLILLVMALFCTLLVGCEKKETFDFQGCVKKLTDAGMKVDIVYRTDDEVAYATSLVNKEIIFMGGNFTAEVTYYTSLLQDEDNSRSCMLFEFANADQAEQYARLNITYFDGKPDWKVAWTDNVVVITNVELAQQIVGLDFQ